MNSSLSWEVIHGVIRKLTVIATLGVVMWVGTEAALTLRALRTGIESSTAVVAQLGNEKTGLAAVVHSDITKVGGDVVNHLDKQLDRAMGMLDNPETGLIQRTDNRTAQALSAVNSAIGAVPGQLDKRLESIQTDVIAEVHNALAGPGGLVPPARELINQYSIMPMVMAVELDHLNETIAATSDPLQKLLTHTNVIVSDFPSCEDSASCPFNLFQGTAKSVEGITQDVHKVTKRVTEPRGAWGTVKDLLGLLTGASRAASAAGAF